MVQKIIILVFILFSCHKSKKDFLTNLSSEKKDELRISYGEKIVNSENFSFGPKFIYFENKACFVSIETNVYSPEFGPYLEFCFYNLNNDIFSSISQILDNWDKNSLEFEPSVSFKSNIGQVTIRVQKYSSFINSLDLINTNQILIGDQLTYNKLVENQENKKVDIYYNHSEDIHTKIHSNFGYPTFSLISSGNHLTIFFRGTNQIYNYSEIPVLILEIELSDITEIQTFFNSIPEKNDNFLETCINQNIVITEIFGSRNSEISRYIEYWNDSDQVICFHNAYLKLNEKTENLSLIKDFLFPHEVGLLIEPDSLLEGKISEYIRWGDLSTQDELTFSFNDHNTSVVFKNQDYEWGNEFFSQKYTEYSCESLSNPYRSNDSFCGDPGVEIKNVSATFTEACRIQDFILTEINPYGVEIENKIYKSEKFIEFKFIGETKCDISNLFLTIEDKLIPFSSRNYEISPNQIIIVGGNSFYDLKSFISRDLEFWDSINKILLVDSLRKEEIVLFNSESNFVLKNSLGNISSIVFKNNLPIHHPVYNSHFLSSFIKNSHFMSPGEDPNFSFDFDYHSTKISEVLWMGSFQGETSITDDRFIEIKNESKYQSILLETIIENESTTYLVPVFNYTILSKKGLVCFPEVITSSHSSFHLKNTDLKIYLKNPITHEIIDSININHDSNQGINDYDNDLRVSYSLTKEIPIWKNSKQISYPYQSTSCPKTFASPGTENDFDSYILKLDSKNDELKFQHIQSYSDTNNQFELTSYSIFPSYEFSNSTFTNSIFEIKFSSFPQSQLSYLKHENLEDLFIYNPKKVYIQAVNPNPSLSQNEWVLLCNKNSDSINIEEFTIEDSSYSDQLTSYLKRKGVNLPSNLSSDFFDGSSVYLNSNECGYVLDPDATNIELEKINSDITKIFTIVSSSTIGNGISKSENLDLFQITSDKFHIHSYGNKYSHKPFSISLETDEVSWLKNNKEGETIDDFETKKNN